MFYVYLLKSLFHKQFYVDSTNDLKQRMKEHNLGKVFSTKRYMPWQLLYYEAYLLEEFARIREQKLKHHGNALRQVKQRAGLYGNSAGFTLVELLASVIVLVAVGSIIAGIISSSLRGANKTNIIENIRQNGNYVLNQMSKDIGYAQPFDGKDTGLSNDDGATYDMGCILSLNPTPTPVTPYNVITVKSANNIVTKYKCSGSVLTANGTSLIDTSSVSLTDCSLSCTQNKPTDIPIIKISFSIGPKNPSSLAENSSLPIVFETSVTMRNYRE